MIRRLVVALVVCTAALPGGAVAHPPGTAIGRAAAGLAEVPVTYDSAAAVGEVEADGLLRVVGPDSRVRVALMPASALTELPGGDAAAVAAEVAREAGVDGTVVVLAGTQLGVWSEDVPVERAAALVRQAERAYPAGSVFLRVTDLVGRLQAEPVDAGTPWAAIAVVVSGLVLAALAGLHLARRRGTRSMS